MFERDIYNQLQKWAERTGRKPLVLRAINNVNNSMKVAKLVISNDSVWVCFENLLDKEHKMEELVPVAVSTLYQGRQRFYAALKEE